MIYLDISTTRKYRGRPVGIVRCEIECIKHALEHKSLPVAFCYYSKLENEFISVSSDEVQELINSIVSSKPTSKKSVLEEQKVPTQRISLYKRLKKIIRMTGSSVIKKAFPPRSAAELIQLVKNVITYQRESLRSIQGVFKVLSTTKQKKEATDFKTKGQSSYRKKSNNLKNVIVFNSNDIFISMGLSWDFLDFADLYQRKMEQGFKVVTVAYDVIPILFREYSNGANELFGRSILDQIWASDMIFCISDNTLNDLEKFILESNIPMRQLKRIRLGSFTRNLNQIDRPKKFEKAIDPGEFVLFVSTMEPRKNHDLAFQVWSTLLFEKFDSLVPLVLVGSPGWNTEDLRRKMALHRNLYPKYLFWGSDIDDEELDWLYQNCRFTIYPSYYEGWGLPVCESLERGKFCIVSNTSSLPEVSQGFAEEIHPLDVLKWKEKIALYLSDDKALKDKELHIQHAYSPVSWTTTYDEFFSELSKIQ